MRTEKIQDNFRLLATKEVTFKTSFYVEAAPQHQLMYYLGKLYNLPLPWTYYIIAFNDMKEYYKQQKYKADSFLNNTITMQAVYCSPVKIRDEKKYLDYLPISNTSPGYCCFTALNVASSITNSTELIHKAISGFWAANGTYFLGTVPSNLLKAISPEKHKTPNYRYNTSYEDWQLLSIDEVLALPYEKLITMEQLLAA